jgi:hypothetical protein
MHGAVIINEKFLRQDSSVGIAMACRLQNRGSIPTCSKIFLFSMVSRPALGPSKLVFGALPLRIMWPGHETDYSPSYSAKVKHGGFMLLLSLPIHLHGVVIN